MKAFLKCIFFSFIARCFAGNAECTEWCFVRSRWRAILTFVFHNRLDKELASTKKLNVSVALILILIHDHIYFLDCINYVIVRLMNSFH